MNSGKFVQFPDIETPRGFPFVLLLCHNLPFPGSLTLNRIQIAVFRLRSFGNVDLTPFAFSSSFSSILNVYNVLMFTTHILTLPGKVYHVFTICFNAYNG